ncbi:LuxR C-terminal-related transcriptional regulator [Edaphobacter paludis]|uniref:LuxR C-terminal-related transcriptional regulator n=2 Tax=Edaphobacter paludis TaxID=3035702 RepID=A0AAU7D774_9BACT
MKSLPSRTCKASSKSSESTSKTKNLVSGLGISEITVNAHRSNVIQKMNADSFPDQVKIVARLRLAPVPKLKGLDYSDLFDFVLPV